MDNQETIRNNAANATARMRETTERASKEAKDVGQQAWDVAKDTYKDVKSAAQDAYESGKKVIKENVGEYSSIVDDVEDYVRSNPAKSILIVAGLFALGARLLKR